VWNPSSPPAGAAKTRIMTHSRKNVAEWGSALPNVSISLWPPRQAEIQDAVHTFLGFYTSRA